MCTLHLALQARVCLHQSINLAAAAWPHVTCLQPGTRDTCLACCGRLYMYVGKLLFFELCLHVEYYCNYRDSCCHFDCHQLHSQNSIFSCLHAYRQRGSPVRSICRQAPLQQQISCCPCAHAQRFCIADSLAAIKLQSLLSAASYFPAGRRRCAGCF